MKKRIILIALIIGMALTSLSAIINCIDGYFEVAIFTVFILFFMGVFLYLGCKIGFENLKCFSILSVILGFFFIATVKTPPNEELSIGGDIVIVLTIVFTLLGVIEVCKYKMQKQSE